MKIILSIIVLLIAMGSYAVEVDFADKWAEAIGQSMHYARLTGKEPAVLLILEKKGDERYLQRLEQTAYWIRVFIIGPEDIKSGGLR